MKIFKLFPIFCVLLFSFALFVSCDKDEVEPTDKDPDENELPGIGNFPVQVIVPAGSGINLEGSTIMSLDALTLIDANGNGTVNHVPKSISVAYVFDKNEQLILAGFISDSSNVISSAGTAELILYLAHGLQYQPASVVESYLKNIDQVPEAKKWIDEFENNFKADPLTFSSGSYIESLTSIMKILTARNSLDIRSGRIADLSLDSNDIKSGLQLVDETLGNFSINNNYRRRAHAFLYKMSYKDEAGKSHKVLNSINTNTVADQNFAVDPVAGVTGFMGEVGKLVESKAGESFVVKSGPATLELKDNETEATYALRIVGPGLHGANTRVAQETEAEDLKLLRLECETMAIDIVIPILSIAMSFDNVKESVGVTDKNKKIVDQIEILVKSTPDVYEEMKKGNYEEAARKLIYSFYKENAAKQLEVFAEDMNLLNGLTNSASYSKKLQKLNKILSTVDLVLGAQDIVRVYKHIILSRSLDEWEITADAGKVKLLPKDESIVPYTNLKITAEIKNVEETGEVHPYFEWSTSGKYGIISDIKGNSGTSFSSAEKQINYASYSKTDDLSDGNNYEYIYVKAYMADKLIGVDTTRINIKKYEYTMTPNGITLTGKEGGANELGLYLEIPKGGINIEPNDLTDFKVIWKIDGKHGTLTGKGIDGVTTLTTFDDNSVWYTCTDDDTKQGSEKIYASIFRKNKDEAEYTLFDEVEGLVNISNDPKKKIIHVPLHIVHGDRTIGEGFQCYVGSAATVAADPDAVSYTLRFIDVPVVIGASTFISWKPGQYPKNSSWDWVAPSSPEGPWSIEYSWTYTSGGSEHLETTGAKGMAEITIYLK